MRSLRRIRTRADRRRRRHMRVRRKVDGTPERPRLVVYRSLKHIYAQLVDDTLGRTLTAASDRSATVEPEGAGKVGKARGVGKMLADRAQELGIKHVVFDRGGYPYHGRVKALAEGARKGGLEF